MSTEYLLNIPETTESIDVALFDLTQLGEPSTASVTNGRKTEWIDAQGNNSYRTIISVMNVMEASAHEGFGITRVTFRIDFWLRSIEGDVTVVKPAHALLNITVPGRTIALVEDTLSAVGMLYSLAFGAVHTDGVPSNIVLNKLAAGEVVVL